MKKTVFQILLGGITVSLISFGAITAHAAELKTEYKLSIAGIPVGKTKIFGSFNSANYQLTSTIKITGLAGIFVEGNGTVNSSGAITQGKLAPSNFTANGKVSKKKHDIQISFPNGNANTVTLSPPLESAPDRVAVTPEHRRATLDPLTALFAPINANGTPLDAANCQRDVPVFDGSARHTIKMSYKGVQTSNLSGYTGQVLVCKIRYVPVAGHRPGRKGVKFMTQNEDIWVWYAPMNETNFLVPVRIHVATNAGVAEANASVLKVK